MELDVAFELFAKNTHTELGKLHSAIKGVNAKPIQRVVGGSAVTVAGGSLLVESQHAVPVGRAWNYLAIGIFGSDGHTPVPFNAIPLCASGVATYNNNPSGVQLTISGGTVTAIAINGTVTGLTSGVFSVPANGTVTVTYTVAPTTFTTTPNSVATPSGSTVDVYSASSGIETPEFTAQLDSGLDIPSIQYYTKWALWGHMGERPLALAYNLPANQQVVLVCRVAEYPVDAVEALTI